MALMREGLGGVRWKTVVDEKESNRLVFMYKQHCQWCLIKVWISVLCISAERLGSGQWSRLSTEESLRAWGEYEDPFSKSRSLASRTISFSRSSWVRLFFKLSSYLHSCTLFIWLHCSQTGRVPVHFSLRRRQDRQAEPRPSIPEDSDLRRMVVGDRWN